MNERIDKTYLKNNGYSQYLKKKNNNYKNYVFNGEEQDKTNKYQMLTEFVNYFNATMKSPISDLIIGFVKTKRICQNCRAGYYSFSNYLYIVFDLSDKDNDTDFDLIYDGFKQKHKTPKCIGTDGPDKIWCEKCQIYPEFKEFNRYYTLNNHLIIVFIRGKNYQNRSKIIFQENINLKDYIEEDINYPKIFKLVGSINRKVLNNKEEYVPYFKDPNNLNNWRTKGFQQIQSDPNEQIIMLFYNSDEY